MKTCPNCRCVYADDYAGTCHECGKGLGSIGSNGGGGLEFRFARQIQRGDRENSMERSMKRGDYDNVPVEESMVDVALRFVSVDREKFVKLGGDLADLK